MRKPILTIIVVIYNMPRQAYNTLQSLSANYQKNSSSNDYEVIAVENKSNNQLSRSQVSSLPENFTYILREESGISPAPAINEALSVAKGQYIGLLIDGARMLTPKVIHFALQGLKISQSIVTVPGYYLTKLATIEEKAKTTLRYEKKLLSKGDWLENGYSLFNEACFSNGNRHGMFHPIMESNALFFNKQTLAETGGIDEDFDLKGGGSLNLHIFRKLCLYNHAPLITLIGEGNMHQYHGGTSTTISSERDDLVAEFKKQLDRYWPGGFKAVTREPFMLGTISSEALPLIEESIIQGLDRFNRLIKEQKTPWNDDESLGVIHGEL